MSGVPADLEETSGPLVPATPRELRRMMADWRRGRATRSLGDAFSDAYVVVIGALMITAMVVNVVLTAQTTAARCDSVACSSARSVLPWATAAAAVALALSASRLFGPVVASAAEGFWLLDAPVDRVRLLARRLWLAVGTALVVGAVAGAAVAALSGTSAAGVLSWSAATALAAAAAVSFAAAQQGIERHRLVRGVGAGFGLLGVAGLLLVVAVAAGWVGFALSGGQSNELGWATAAASAVALGAGLVLARRRLGRIRRVRLTSGGALVGGLSGAFFGLDLGLARDIVVTRRAIEIGHVRPQRGRGLGRNALVWRELQRLRRFPRPLFVVAGTVVVPYAADALGMTVLAPVFGALALFGALIGMLGGLRVLTRTKGLARSLPFTLAQLKLAAVTLPAVVAGLWAVATTGAFVGFGDGAVDRRVDEALMVAVVTAAAGLLGAIRWAQAKPIDFGAPMVSTQAGAFPPGLVSNVFRGFDMCVLITAPLLLGLSPLWGLALAAIVAGILLNSLDADTLRARQAEQQRLLEAEKKRKAAAASAAKQRKR